MSLLLAGLVFAGTSGALMVGRWVARRRVGPPDEDPAKANANAGTPKPRPSGNGDRDAEASDDDLARAAQKEVEDAAPTRKDESRPKLAAVVEKKRRRRRPPPGGRAPLEGFVCQLGDVVMRLTGEEAWLAGGVVLSEQVPVAVLFVAPDAGHDCVVYVRARPNEGLFWLDPLDPQAILVGGEPPSSVEHGGIRFDRARRLPLRPRRIGVGAPDTGDAVIVAEYTSAGSERLVVMKSNAGNVYAYRGLELEPGSFEVIASGASTLES